MRHATRAILALGFALAACACAGGQPAPQPSSSPASAPPPSEVEPIADLPPAPAENACGGKTCVPPEECIRYYGIAGPSLPLYTCGIPCDENGTCADGKDCATIADGPRLCR